MLPGLCSTVTGTPCAAPNATSSVSHHSALPSVEPLSTTIISHGASTSVSVSSAERQRRVQASLLCERVISE